jgi:hypothetical protein
MLRKLCNGARAQWQSQLPDALMAYRNAVSTVTGYTPFFLYHGRRARIPLSTMLAGAEPPPDLLGNRLATMSTVLLQAQEHTRESRHFNRERLARKATAGDIAVGDSVIVAANEPVTLSAKWDHQFEVTKIRGLTFWIRHQITNKELKVHRDKLRLVDPNMAWDNVADRPRRQQARRIPVIEPPQGFDADIIRNHPPGGPRERPLAPATCRAEIHAEPPPVNQMEIDVPDAPEQRPATVNPPAPPACSHMPHAPAPPPASMTTEPPAYVLRKRNAVGWVINPSDAKRSRISCLSFIRDWYTTHIHDTAEHLPHSTPPAEHGSTQTAAGVDHSYRTPPAGASTHGATRQQPYSD